MKIIVSFLLFWCCSSFAFAQKNLSFTEPTEAEKKLFQLINEYRKSLKLPAIRFSKSLTYVAKLHVIDLAAYPPQGKCIEHGWSIHGSWTPCCYTIDHKKAHCMWDKPRELTNYPGNGYENAVRGTILP